MSEITAGRLLRSNTRGCVVGCHVRHEPPSLGSMVSIPIASGHIFGLIFDIHIDDDGLVRQLAASDSVTEEIIQDNRLNRNTPLEMSILFIGHQTEGVISHLLPPNPPLSLNEMFLCSPDEICAFTSHGRFGYFRHIITEQNAPTADLFGKHFRAVQPLQNDNGNPAWREQAINALISLLRDDHTTLINVLGAISDAFQMQ